MTLPFAEELSVSDIAAQRGVTPRTVRRWLHRLNARSGGRAVWRSGDAPKSPLRTTMRALKEADPKLIEEKEIVRDEVLELRRTIASMKKESNAMKAQMKMLTDAISFFMKVGQARTK